MEVSMRLLRLARIGALASVVGLAACGGSSSPPTQPSPTPSPTPAPTSNAAISILGNRGNQSFTPNPGSDSGGMTSWKNNDNLVHRIMANDGSFDTGDIGPGQTSAAEAVPAAGINYHCTIHPGMIGAINAAAGPPPPCTGSYC
jgi:plastocyanin